LKFLLKGKIPVDLKPDIIFVKDVKDVKIGCFKRNGMIF
jgi:hypothetical protein